MRETDGGLGRGTTERGERRRGRPPKTELSCTTEGQSLPNGKSRWNWTVILRVH